jgi:hypothetical protein
MCHFKSAASVGVDLKHHTQSLFPVPCILIDFPEGWEYGSDIRHDYQTRQKLRDRKAKPLHFIYLLRFDINALPILP